MKKRKSLRIEIAPLSCRPEDIPDVLPAGWTWEGDIEQDRERAKVTAQRLRSLAAMLPKPLAPDELRDIFQTFQQMIFSESKIGEGNNEDHLRLRDLWLSIGEKSFELQKLLLKELPKNGFPARLRQLKFYHDYCHHRAEILLGLELLTKSSGDHFIFLDKLAKSRKGGRSPSSELSYALLLKLWIDRGGRPAISMKGPCATFLMDASELLLGDAPDQGTVPGIVKRAKKTLGSVYGGKYSAI